MKNALIGLAALVMGCATTGAMQGAESQIQQERPISIVWAPGGQPVQPGVPVVPEPSSATRVEPVMENIGASILSQSVCGNNEPVITMDEHSYTLQCGEYTFMHYQHPEQLDVNGNVVLEAACEDTLTQRVNPIVEPNLTYTKRWIDRDCNEVVDNYAAWEEREGRAPRSMTIPEEPAPDSRTEVYQGIRETLKIDAIQQEWESLYSLL